MSDEQPVVYGVNIAGGQLVAREVRGREAISSPFRLEAQLQLPEGVDIDPDAVVKSVAAITVRRDDVIRTITGVVSEVFVEATLTGQPELTVVLEPRFALARYRQDMRAFRDKTVPQIVAEVLGGLGVSFELRLSSSYPVRRYCVQHRETDLHFVSRLLEEEGIFYFFAAGDVMVLGDSLGAYEPVAGPTTVSFRAEAGLDQVQEAVWAFGPLARASVSKVSLRDWTSEAPSLSMDVEAAGPTASGPEFYDFPGEYDNPGEGQRIADLMAEAYNCTADAFAGKAYCGGFAAGHRFTLESAPDSSLDGAYLLVEVRHDWHIERGGLSLSFEALSAEVTYRPVRVHEEPILPNPVTGIVTGPAGADIHTDERGHVKVHFHWDRLQPLDDQCSDWIPVLQDNTGHSIAMPRVGWEVLVHYLEGDPDRPVVLGRVYNAEDTFPAVLPRDKTQTALKSLSTPTRDGTNEIKFEDKAGKELIMVFAEKDQNVVVAHDKDEQIGVDVTHTVKRNRTVAVDVDQAETVGADLTRSIEGSESLSVGGKRERSAAVDTSAVGGDRSLSIGSMHMRRIGTDDTVAVGQNISEQVGGVIAELSVDGNSSESNKVLATVVGGALIELAKGDKSESATKARAELIGGVVLTKATGEIQTRVGKTRFTTVGGSMTVKAAEELSLTGKEGFKAKSAKADHAGTTSVTLKVGDSTVLMKDGLIHIDAKQTITLKITDKNEQGADESFQI